MWGRTSWVRERVKPKRHGLPRNHPPPNLPSMEPGYGGHPGSHPPAGEASLGSMTLRLSSSLWESLLCAQVQGAPTPCSCGEALSSRAAVLAQLGSCLPRGQWPEGRAQAWSGASSRPSASTLQTRSLTRPRPRRRKAGCLPQTCAGDPPWAQSPPF